MTSEQYTAAVNFIADYVKNTDVIFERASPGVFDDTRQKLQEAVQLLRDNPDYVDGKVVIS